MRLRTLADAERYLDGFVNRERTAHFDYEKLGVERIRALLREVGDPQQGLPCVHITGSKGKGSMALACERLLVAAGLRVGTFTKPHLVSWRERFRIQEESVAGETLVAALRELVPVLERLRADPELAPSFFDVCTALAIELFRRAGVGAAIFEVGIGGRIDSTNVVESRVAALTAVQLEHTDKLGDTLEAIATEKAGIMRPGVPFLHGPLRPGPLGVVLASAACVDAPVEQVAALAVRSDEKGISFRLADGREVRSPVLGEHQATNLALAVRAAEHFLGRSLEEQELGSLGELSLPARLERFGDVLLDCSHTPDSARALRRTVEAIWGERPWVLVLSLSRDKDAPEILRELAPRSRACVLCRAEASKSFAPEELEPLVWASGIERVELRSEPRAALASARELIQAGELLVATGSVYLAGALRPALLERA